MAISKKIYSFDDKVFLHYSCNTYSITFSGFKLTTTNPKKAIELFAGVIKRYLNSKMTRYLFSEGRNTKTGCKQHMSCEMCLMTGKYENQDCYKNNPEQFYEMFNKHTDEQKQVGMTAREIREEIGRSVSQGFADGIHNPTKEFANIVEEAVNEDEYSSQGVGIGVSDS